MKSGSQKTFVSADYKKRMTITVGILVCGFCVLIAALANISLINHDRYSELAMNQQLRDTVITPQRGTIYDTNMNVLAQSATVWTVALSPMDIDEDERADIARGLSDILGVDYATVLAQCEERNYYSIVKRKVDQPLVDEIRQYMVDNGLSGISFTEDSKRYYPYGNFCAQVLGFVGVDNQGLSGLEAYYDTTLSGTAGRVLSAKNAVGSDMYYEYETIYEAEDGRSLVLTIDEVIQHYLEKHLERAMEVHNVQEGVMGIVMNVKTGEILAMATKPDFDPNDPLYILDEDTRLAIEALTDETEYLTALDSAQQEQWRNKTISEVYEPGSVFKVITASAALEAGAATLNSSYYCKGYEEVGDRRMNCAHTEGHGVEDFTLAVINSCNPAFIQIGRSLGSERFFSFFKAFGLTEKTGIDLPGEAGSIYYDETMSAVSLASCAFGQSNAVTPIQMITAVSAAVNGGYLVQPHIVKQVLAADGSVVETIETQTKRQVISAETSETMSGILERVVVEGNSQNAYVAGYRIGGKSGTSQKLNGGEGYITSFCAVAPMDDPEIAVLVLYNNAHSEVSIYGGTIVAPVVGSIMADVLPYIGVDPVYSEEELGSVNVATPMVTGINVTSASAWLQPEGLSYEIIGGGTMVTDQFPAAGQSVPRGSTVFLYTEGAEMRYVSVPDVTGRSYNEATALLKGSGLNIKTEGSPTRSATAVSQSIAVGDTVAAGSVVTVEFVNQSVVDDV